MTKYFSERELNYFIRKYEVSGEWDFILKLWDEGELNFRMPFRDLWSELEVSASESLSPLHNFVTRLGSGSRYCLGDRLYGQTAAKFKRPDIVDVTTINSPLPYPCVIVDNVLIKYTPPHTHTRRRIWSWGVFLDEQNVYYL